jgi:single-stranded DNA-binding protein
MRLNENNEVYMAGEIISDFQFSHEVFGEKFYIFDLKINRLSGKFDVLPIMVSERILDVTNSPVGADVEIEGQLRSYNQNKDGKSKLVLSIFAETITNLDEPKNANIVTLQGFVCKQPNYRKTPLGRDISDFTIAVNRPYAKSDYIPSIAWGRNAIYLTEQPVGTEIRVVGRFQSREYTKKLENGESKIRTAFEFSSSRLEVVNNECED